MQLYELLFLLLCRLPNVVKRVQGYWPGGLLQAST